MTSSPGRPAGRGRYCRLRQLLCLLTSARELPRFACSAGSWLVCFVCSSGREQPALGWSPGVPCRLPESTKSVLHRQAGEGTTVRAVTSDTIVIDYKASTAAVNDSRVHSRCLTTRKALPAVRLDSRDNDPEGLHCSGVVSHWLVRQSFSQPEPHGVKKSAAKHPCPPVDSSPPGRQTTTVPAPRNNAPKLRPIRDSHDGQVF